MDKTDLFLKFDEIFYVDLGGLITQFYRFSSFIVALYRCAVASSSVRPKFFTPRRNIAAQFGLNMRTRRNITELFFYKSKEK